MESILNSSLTFLPASLSAVAGVWFGYKGACRLARALRNNDSNNQSLPVVLGIRGLIVAAGLLAIASGLGFKIAWPVWFGLAFLAEELVETGIMLFALKHQRRAESTQIASRTRRT